MSQSTPRRGRPPNSASAGRRKADEVIAKSVYELDGFGFALNGGGGVFQCVANAAHKHLNRLGMFHLPPLSAKRVEQIYRGWKFKEYHRRFVLRELTGPVFPPQTWSRYTKATLVRRTPWSLRGLPLQEMADHIVMNEGTWDSAEQDAADYIRGGYIAPELELTEGALDEILSGPLPASIRRAYLCGREPKKTA